MEFLSRILRSGASPLLPAPPRLKTQEGNPQFLRIVPPSRPVKLEKKPCATMFRYGPLTSVGTSPADQPLLLRHRPRGRRRQQHQNQGQSGWSRCPSERHPHPLSSSTATASLSYSAPHPADGLRFRHSASNPGRSRRCGVGRGGRGRSTDGGRRLRRDSAAAAADGASSQPEAAVHVIVIVVVVVHVKHCILLPLLLLPVGPSACHPAHPVVLVLVSPAATATSAHSRGPVPPASRMLLLVPAAAAFRGRRPLVTHIQTVLYFHSIRISPFSSGKSHVGVLLLLPLQFS